ncbi:MAG TPA: acyl-CoA dehydrogenase family protein [Burkholderiales bacterium]|nr:acyl-CoA dehydrogenase family protein [Burkholderiales bacterium]
MDLAYGAAYAAFRDEVKAFLKANWPSKDTPKGSPAEALAGVPRVERERAFRTKAVEAGYLYRNVPRRYGGSEQAPDPLRADIIREEFFRAGAPLEVPGNGVSMLVPTLLERGAEWQRERFIPKTLSGEHQWAQGYSEPGSGSDLASLRTKGELRDGQWVVNGQKIWTSFAYRCQYIFVLVRTEPEKPKHEGISYLLMDLKQPGITIRPLKQMTGQSEFCEVFFDNAVTPADWIVGERGQGWSVSRSTLKHERGFIAGAERQAATFGSLVGLARRCTKNGKPAIEDPDVRQRLAAILGYIESFRYSSFRQLSMNLRGQDAGIFNFMTKIAGSNTNQDMAKLARDLLGDDLLLAPPAGQDRDDVKGKRRGNEQWVAQYMSSLALSIAGGTSNIQRNIVAERGLGLPRSV